MRHPKKKTPWFEIVILILRLAVNLAGHQWPQEMPRLENPPTLNSENPDEKTEA